MIHIGRVAIAARYTKPVPNGQIDALRFTDTGFLTACQQRILHQWTDLFENGRQWQKDRMRMPMKSMQQHFVSGLFTNRWYRDAGTLR